MRPPLAAPETCGSQNDLKKDERGVWPWSKWNIFSLGRSVAKTDASNEIILQAEGQVVKEFGRMAMEICGSCQWQCWEEERLRSVGRDAIWSLLKF